MEGCSEKQHSCWRRVLRKHDVRASGDMRQGRVKGDSFTNISPDALDILASYTEYLSAGRKLRPFRQSHKRNTANELLVGSRALGRGLKIVSRLSSLEFTEKLFLNGLSRAQLRVQFLFAVTLLRQMAGDAQWQ